MTADAILQGLLEANLAAGAAVLLVLLLRRVVRAHGGAAAAYGLWLLPPVAALGSLVPARVSAVQPGMELGDAALVGAGVLLGGADGAAIPFDLSSVLLILWLAGAAAFAALAIFRSRRLAGDPAVGPALVGVIRPRLVLPADFETRFDAAERRLILAHEAVHETARHPAVNGLVEAARCLNWFNPLIHVAAFYARIDQELACDAAVLARHPAERRTYAEALLKSQLSPAFLPLGCQWPGRSKPLLTERIAMLAQPRTSRAHHFAAAAAIALASVGGACATWAAQPPRPAVANASVLAAIEAGDGLAVRARGGTPKDVVEAMKAAYRTRQPGGPTYAARTLAELDRFADTTGGATLAFVPFTGPDFKTPAGKGVGGAHWGIERRTRDGMVQYVMLMKDGKLFMGAPRPAETAAATGAASDASAAPADAQKAAKPAPQVVKASSEPPKPRALVTAPDWVRRPVPADVARFYPPAAAAQGLPGRATISCIVDAAGALQKCEVVSEDPAGAGFGEAALAMASTFQMKPMDKGGVATGGAVVRIPMRFTPNPAPAGA